MVLISPRRPSELLSIAIRRHYRLNRGRMSPRRLLSCSWQAIDEPGRLGPFLPTDNGRLEELWDYGPTKDTIMAASWCTLICKFRQQWGEGKRILVTGPP